MSSAVYKQYSYDFENSKYIFEASVRREYSMDLRQSIVSMMR